MKNCPECGASSPVHEIRDVRYAYKGRETIIPAVVGYHCMVCSGVTLDKDAVNRYSELIGLFQRKIDSEQIGPDAV